MPIESPSGIVVELQKNMYMNKKIYSYKDIHLSSNNTQLRQDNSFILIYLDETWVNAHHTDEYYGLTVMGKEGGRYQVGRDNG